MRQRPDNDFDELMTDTLTLLKQNGARHDNIRANVQPGTILTLRVDIPFEERDTLVRKLPNRLVERYTILNAHHSPGLDELPPTYRIKVRKETAISAAEFAAVTNNYNLSGHNARVNVSSTDNSINVVGFADGNAFAALRERIVAQVPDDAKRGELLTRLDDMEQVKDTPGFGQHYRDFVGTVADHWSLFGPLLLALAQHLR